MPDQPTWSTDELLVIGNTTYRLLPDRAFYWDAKSSSEQGPADFLVAKSRWLVERHIRLIEEIRPEYIFELGVFQGGSTALLVELARPRRLVAIDQLPGDKRHVTAHAVERGLG